LALGLLVLAITHLSALVAGCLLMAASGLARALAAIIERDADGRGAGAIALRLTKDALWSIAAALPALGLVVGFVIAYPTETVDAGMLRYSILSVIRRLAELDYLFAFTRWEIAALAPAIAAMAVAAMMALRRWRAGDLVWPCFVVLVLLVSALDPRSAQGVPLAERLAAYSWVGAALAIAPRLKWTKATRVLCLMAAVALVGQATTRVLAYRSWADTLSAAAQAGRDHPHATFAGFDGGGRPDGAYAWRVVPSIHAHQIAAIAAGGVGMGSSLPSLRYYGYYPLRYVAERDLLFTAPQWEQAPRRVSLAPFRAAHEGAQSA
jgi:hypothetical protein